MKIWTRLFGNNQGFTLAEIVTASAVLGVVAAGGATTYARYIRSSQEMDLRDTMSSIRKEIETAFTIPSNLTRSLTEKENAEFFQCFGGALFNNFAKAKPGDKQAPPPATPNLVCKFTDGSKFYPLVLKSAVGGTIAGGTSSIDGKSSTSSRRIMKGRGQTCTPQELAANDDACEIEVTSAFRAVCPPQQPGMPPANECVTPSSVEFFYTVKQLKTGMLFKRNIKFPGFSNMSNADGSMRDRVDAIRIKALDFMRPELFQCPDGQTFKGYDANGKIQCGFQENPCERNGPQYKNWIFQKVEADGSITCQKPLQGEDCEKLTGDKLAVLKGVDANGNLVCERPKISDQGCKDGEVLVRFDETGKPECVNSVLGKLCPNDKFLVGYDDVGNPRCVDMRTPSGEIFTVQGTKCGHQHGNCNYGSGKKPDGWVPKCPADTFTVKVTYSGTHCCATCGWVGQWWCDYLVATCSPYTTAKWH